MGFLHDESPTPLHAGRRIALKKWCQIPSNLTRGRAAAAGDVAGGRHPRGPSHGSARPAPPPAGRLRAAARRHTRAVTRRPAAPHPFGRPVPTAIAAANPGPRRRDRSRTAGSPSSLAPAGSADFLRQTHQGGGRSEDPSDTKTSTTPGGTLT